MCNGSGFLDTENVDSPGPDETGDLKLSATTLTTATPRVAKTAWVQHPKMPEYDPRAEKVSFVSEPKYHLFTPYEKHIFARTEKWLMQIPTGIDPDEILQFDEEELLIVCMTPRSGSSVLSAILAQTNSLGLGGERLSTKPGSALHQAVFEGEAPKTLAGALDKVISASRTDNGIAHFKCDFPQFAPFAYDRAAFDRMRHAKFVYLTRGDVLAQSISRYRGVVTDDWHAQHGTREAVEVPYDFVEILRQMKTITHMMAAFERMFALLGIQPHRISYEQVISGSETVVADLASRVGIKLRKSISPDQTGHVRMADDWTREMTERFLADFNGL